MDRLRSGAIKCGLFNESFLLHWTKCEEWQQLHNPPFIKYSPAIQQCWNQNFRICLVEVISHLAPAIVPHLRGQVMQLKEAHLLSAVLLGQIRSQEAPIYDVLPISAYN
jgi:hypothetical protein